MSVGWRPREMGVMRSYSRRAFLEAMLGGSGLFTGCLGTSVNSGQSTERGSLSDVHDPDNWDGWEARDSEITVDKETSMTGTASLRVAADTDSSRVAARYGFASQQDFSGRYPVCGLRWMSDTGGLEAIIR